MINNFSKLLSTVKKFNKILILNEQEIDSQNNLLKLIKPEEQINLKIKTSNYLVLSFKKEFNQFVEYKESIFQPISFIKKNALHTFFIAHIKGEEKDLPKYFVDHQIPILSVPKTTKDSVELETNLNKFIEATFYDYDKLPIVHNR